MPVSGIVLAVLTVTIGMPGVGGARPTHPGPPATRVACGPSDGQSPGYERARQGIWRTAGTQPRVLSSALVASSPEGSPVAWPDPAPIDLVVELRDLARVPLDVMRDTKVEVEHTFLAVGVRIIWADPGRAPRDEPAPLRLFLVGSAPRTVRSDEAPLVAMLGVAPESGEWAQVFYGRVAAAVARRQVPIGVVLAHVMAHELGHLLLPPNSHSAVGVMRRSVDLTHPTSRRFTDEQAGLIRAALASGRRYAWSCSS